MEFKIFSVFDGKIVPEDILPTVSVVWQEMYNEAGKMQVVFPRTEKTFKLVKPHKFGMIDDSATMMYIYATKTDSSQNLIWAYGYEAKGLLSKVAVFNNSQDGEVSIDAAIRDKFVLASLSYMPYGLFSGSGTANLDGLEYYDLYDFICQCMRIAGGGWRAVYDGEKLNVFGGADGADFSEAVVFSPVFGNVSGVTVTRSNQSDISRVYAIGDDNGTTVIVYAGNNAEDGEVYSAFLDCRLDFPKPEDMSSADYLTALETRANMSLIARHSTVKVEIANTDTTGFGSLYTLGDTVRLALPEEGIDAKMRVEGVQYTYESSIKKTALSFKILGMDA